MATKKAEVVATLAKKMGFDTLETRKSDSLDFREVAVWEVKAALEAAFDAGNLAAIERLAGRAAKSWEASPGVCGFCGAEHKRDPKHAAGDKAERHHRVKTYPVKRGDGSTVKVTVPPRACRACGGDGCKACNGTGDEPEGK